MIIRHLLIAAIVLAVGACAVYPSTRTFYEVDPSDGTPKNRASCGYTNTKDSVQRMVDGIEIFVSPGKKEDISGDPDPTFTVRIQFWLPEGMRDIAVDPSRVEVVVDGEALKPEVVANTERPSRRSQGNYKWLSLQLRYPSPSGLKKHLSVVFQSGAVLLNEHSVAVAPFRFSRVMKSDLYYGSINC